MSRPPLPGPPHKPLIALVDRLNRALQIDMVRAGHAAGFPELKHAHNLVFGTLSSSHGSHTADMAARAGITRQSMGEVVRELMGLGIVEMTVDPEDRRAKLVTYTDYGLGVARAGRQHIADLEQRFAEEFGEEEYALVRDVLARIVELVEPGER
ncbi:MarR family winged helix-turn-helix transcriptional regulator [Nocardioides sp.]|uniref:MarR family winged helix-turn-helix transcriptional regulator n=1 Tax=Nocardioides sp. TaxID=35761 RepID=UPI002ED68962